MTASHNGRSGCAARRACAAALGLAMSAPLSAWAQPRPTAGDATMMAAMESMKPVTSSFKPTGDVDRDFMQLMIPHHEAGITMSLAQERLGKHPQLRKLAQGDVKDQRKDNAEMRQYLKGGGKGGPRSAAAGSPSVAMLNAMEKMNASMDGMKMTGDQDHDFIRMMIPHHDAAIDMANIELRNGHDPRVKKVAKGVSDGRTKKVEEMTARAQGLVQPPLPDVGHCLTSGGCGLRAAPLAP